jgi:predicted enzyme related to lactoylglutathione lyase
MLRIAYVTFESQNPRHLAGFWGNLLGADVTHEGGEAWLTAATDHGNGYVNLLFVQSENPHSARNRVSLELAPDNYSEQLNRALNLGATIVDQEPEGEPWTLMADPEGNEFVILEQS